MSVKDEDEKKMGKKKKLVTQEGEEKAKRQDVEKMKKMKMSKEKKDRRWTLYLSSPFCVSFIFRGTRHVLLVPVLDSRDCNFLWDSSKSLTGISCPSGATLLF